MQSLQLWLDAEGEVIFVDRIDSSDVFGRWFDGQATFGYLCSTDDGFLKRRIVPFVGQAWEDPNNRPWIVNYVGGPYVVFRGHSGKYKTRSYRDLADEGWMLLDGDHSEAVEDGEEGE